jgi:hypothetical protein
MSESAQFTGVKFSQQYNDVSVKSCKLYSIFDVAKYEMGTKVAFPICV